MSAVPSYEPVRVIPTRYRGVLYRSRTEARYAVFFDRLGVEAVYEPEGYILPSGAYLPDFYIPAWQIFVEVKGEAPIEVEITKARELAKATHKRVLIVSGDPLSRRGRAFPDTTIEQMTNAAFAKCRQCAARIITLEFEHGYGQVALDPCGGNPLTCGDKFSEPMRGLEEEGAHAKNERFGVHESKT